MKMRRKAGALVALGALLAVAFSPSAAQAALTPSLSQTINAGTQVVDIVDGNGASVASPSVTFAAKSFSFDCQTSTGTLGVIDGSVAENSRIISVKNPKKAGVKLDLNATDPVAGVWDETTTTDSYKYNDPAVDVATSTAGCLNGQLSVSGGSFNKTAGSGTPTYTIGSGSYVFSAGTTAPIAIFDNTSHTAYNGELTGYTLSQKIPGSTPEGTYALPMTITVTAQ